MKKIILTLILGFLLPVSAFCGAADDYIVERGKTYFEAGNISDAEAEFKKALMANPYNAEASAYLKQIRLNRIKEALREFPSLDKAKGVKKETVSSPKVSSKPTTKKSYSRKEPAKKKSSRKKSTRKKAVSKKETTRTPQIEDIKVVEPQEKSAALPADKKVLKEALAKEIPAKETYKEEAPPAYSYKQEAKRVVEVEKESIPAYPKEEAYSQEETMPEYLELYPEEKPKEDTDIKVSGKIHASFGLDSDDGFIWKRANADMNEKNWRILAGSAFNERDNTYDPAIFDRLRFKVEKPASGGWGFGTDFDISPWSFIGKSSEIRIVNPAGDDTANIVLKYWANNNYTINETFYSESLGNFFNVPELKVADGKIKSYAARGYDEGGHYRDVFTIPEAEIYRQFWPAREVWAGYNKEGLTFKVFPVAKESLAYNSDDPLNLSNHHIYYEESQWLVNWHPGHFNEGSPQDFFKGWWDDSLAFMTRDSRGERLTALRGLSLKLDTDQTLFDFTVASPKDLWQDYESFSTYAAASRLKYFCLDNLTLGLVHGSKLGDDDSSLDVHSHFAGLDFNLGLGSNTQIFAEAVSSGGEQDKTSDYQTKKRGNAFHVNLVNSSKESFGKDYFSIEPGEGEKRAPFYKLKLSLTHMDEDFESALSSFRDTRNDTFWGRHLSFREPFEIHLPSINDVDFGWNDVKNFRIGDGIDYGRDVVSLRIETKNLPLDKLDTLFDIRNVHDVGGLYIENVSRLEATYKAVPKLTAKILGIYHDLPKTDKGVDPFIFDPVSGDYYENISIDEDNDPSLKTASLGLKYDFFKWLDANFIWEHTNDCTLAYADFPRKLFESSWMSTYDEYGHTVRQVTYGLTNTDIFPKPPYPYFDIFKLGIALRPKDNLRLRVDYTRNEYNWVQIIDDNINHIGFDIRYFPFKKLGFYFRYVYSRANDISALSKSSELARSSHHSIFSEIQLKMKEDSELALQYGVVPSQGLFASTYSPFGTASPTLDTEHIIKLYFSKKF